MTMTSSEIQFVHSPLKQLQNNPLKIAASMIPVIAALSTMWHSPLLRNLAILILLLSLMGGQRKYGWTDALRIK